ncbi:E3 ubiquitin-protein ligase RZF1-like [Citrus sinensis]|uniref:E3 ubiquitin-protein ligase RZF1-like n=1 Tax=Citrus sinensis TaxID=2711 RepID=UPI002279592F|nr:E3 ubiquitin-protein ligase RZF1-like [Citrus sinensis]
MDLLQFRLHEVHGRSSSSNNPVGNISIMLNERFQKQYRSRNGRVIILEDYTFSPKSFPLIQIPSDSVALPVCLAHALTALNINRMLCNFLIREISNVASYLSFGGSVGFHLFAEVHALGIEVVEGEGDDEEMERLLRKEASRITVEMLSRKQRSSIDNKGVIVKEGDTCAVCLEELMEKEENKGEEEEEVIPMPCHHNFHASCISRWLEEQNSCPMCRREIRYEDLVG